MLKYMTQIIRRLLIFAFLVSLMLPILNVNADERYIDPGVIDYSIIDLPNSATPGNPDSVVLGSLNLADPELTYDQMNNQYYYFDVDIGLLLQNRISGGWHGALPRVQLICPDTPLGFNEGANQNGYVDFSEYFVFATITQSYKPFTVIKAQKWNYHEFSFSITRSYDLGLNLHIEPTLSIGNDFVSVEFPLGFTWDFFFLHNVASEEYQYTGRFTNDYTWYLYLPVWSVTILGYVTWHRLDNQGNTVATVNQKYELNIPVLYGYDQLFATTQKVGNFASLSRTYEMQDSTHVKIHSSLPTTIIREYTSGYVKQIDLQQVWDAINLLYIESLEDVISMFNFESEITPGILNWVETDITVYKVKHTFLERSGYTTPPEYSRFIFASDYFLSWNIVDETSAPMIYKSSTNLVRGITVSKSSVYSYETITVSAYIKDFGIYNYVSGLKELRVYFTSYETSTNSYYNYILTLSTPYSSFSLIRSMHVPYLSSNQQYIGINVKATDLFGNTYTLTFMLENAGYSNSGGRTIF